MPVDVLNGRYSHAFTKPSSKRDVHLHLWQQVELTSVVTRLEKKKKKFELPKENHFFIASKKRSTVWFAYNTQPWMVQFSFCFKFLDPSSFPGPASLLLVCCESIPVYHPPLQWGTARADGVIQS